MKEYLRWGLHITPGPECEAETESDRQKGDVM